MTEDNNSIQKRKKGFKHSKKFARSQKGCLQCRQKKKKCDMTRPGCQSCSKRGIGCEYPENIKIFQIESFKTYEPTKEDGTKDLTRTPKMKMHEIKLEKQTNVFALKNEQPIPEKNTPKETQQRLSAPPTIHTTQKATVESHRQPSPSSPLSENISLSTHLPIEQPQEYHSPAHHQEAQPQHVQHLLSILNTNTNNTDNAISLATEGQSIKTILDGFAIDLIKRSIESLQYVNLEKQQRQYEQTRRYELEQQENVKEWAIKEALKFGNDKGSHDGILSVNTEIHREPTGANEGVPSVSLGHDALLDWEGEIFKVGWQG